MGKNDHRPHGRRVNPLMLFAALVVLGVVYIIVSGAIIIAMGAS